ncbi:MAG: uroporphyrinogen-III synthase [Balneolaceae bacterium]|nr:uroporphyrinogen-III synthase [Balneolaceae bacterium]
MRQYKKNILVTKSLTGQQREYARIMGLNPIVQPALEFTFPEYWDRVLKLVNDYPKSDWIFTSSNAVEALSRLIKSGLTVRPETTLFAVGAKTARTLDELGLDAMVPDHQDAEHLAGLIIERGDTESVLYFRGNLSRDELPDRLKQAGIDVAEAVVYETEINTLHLPGKPVQAILFYSPSGVEAFEKGEGFDRQLPLLFAIGPTTADALRERTDQEVYTAEKPSTEHLLRTVAEHLFKESAAPNE